MLSTPHGAAVGAVGLRSVGCFPQNLLGSGGAQLLHPPVATPVELSFFSMICVMCLNDMRQFCIVNQIFP
jgi:hypothetical protein